MNIKINCLRREKKQVFLSVAYGIQGLNLRVTSSYSYAISVLRYIKQEESRSLQVLDHYL